MVNESGSVSSLYVAAPRGGTLSSVGTSPRVHADVQDTSQATAGQTDRPGFSSLYAQIRASMDLRGEAALQLRQAQSGLQQADDLLVEIKSRLVQIVKQYPPFSQDSPQRIAYLNAITGLRQQLDALAFPPERQDQNDRLADVEWQKTLPPQAVSPAPGDLAIPDLDPRTASDDEVGTALDAVMKAQDRVNEIKGEMWQDVVRYVGETNLGQIADYKARSLAEDVRGYAAANPARGIGVSAQTILANGV